MPLADLQGAVRQAVVGGPIVDSLSSLLVGGRRPEARLAIHARHYETSLVKTIAGRFPATVWLMGSEFVVAAAREFVHTHPPQAPCLAEYGAAFPAFAAARPGAERAPYLREFAELEWHLGQVALAVAHPALGPERLAGIDPAVLAQSTAALQPGVRYQRVTWPVDRLMALFLSGTAPDRLAFDPERVDLELRGARGEFHMTRLAPGDWAFRAGAAAGLTLGTAAERAFDADPAFDPGAGLLALVREGLLVALDATGGDRRGEPADLS